MASYFENVSASQRDVAVQCEIICSQSESVDGDSSEVQVDFELLSFS